MLSLQIGKIFWKKIASKSYPTKYVAGLDEAGAYLAVYPATSHSGKEETFTSTLLYPFKPLIRYLLSRIYISA